MTREIKAGLVVSCSFICLVGVVVTTKLHEKNQAARQAPPPPWPRPTMGRARRP